MSQKPKSLVHITDTRCGKCKFLKKYDVLGLSMKQYYCMQKHNLNDWVSPVFAIMCKQFFQKDD